MGSGKLQEWDSESLTIFYDAFHKHGQDWVQVRPPLKSWVASTPSSTMRADRTQVAAACGPGRSPEMCESLHQQHMTFLSLAHSPALSAAFVAMVQVRQSRGRMGGFLNLLGPWAYSRFIYWYSLDYWP